jgi:FlaA1/EpsC-like NDP-sugar epimerase
VLNSLLASFLGLLSSFNRQSKQLIQVGYDALGAVLAAVMALYVNGLDSYIALGQTLLWLAAIGVVAPLLFMAGGVYRNVVRFLAVSVALRLGLASLLVGMVSALLFGLLEGVFSWRIMFDVALILAVAGLFPRALLRLVVEQSALLNKPTAIIYGAGAAGRQLLSTLRTAHNYRIVGFVDDDASLSGATIMGHSVWRPSKIDAAIYKHDVKTVLLAIPSAGIKKEGPLLSHWSG